MATRTYGQYCGLARALELVGERWALLVVRDLIPGPKRFTDLRRGLARIPTNVLSSRLKELEEAAIVQRRVLPRPSASVVYELTEYGRELEPIVRSLLLWGAKALDDPRPEDTANPSAIVVGLRSMFRPAAARGLRATFELRIGDNVVHARVDDGAAEVDEGPLPGADLTIETDLVFGAIMRGELSPAAASRTGAVGLTGDAHLFERFVELFPMPRPLAA